MPRFRELLNATEKISTPSMTFPVEDLLVRHAVVGDMLEDPAPGTEVPRIFYMVHARFHRLEKPVAPRPTILQVSKAKSEGCTFLEIKTAIIAACEQPVVGTVSTSDLWLFDVAPGDLERVKATVVGGIPGVTKQFTQHGRTTTEGSSDLYAAIALHAEAVTNDVLETCRVLGVEAANRMLLQEMKTVMEAACYINERHIQLLVDTMTRTGNVVAASRHGMSKTKQPVLQRASFEVRGKKKMSRNMGSHLFRASVFSKKISPRSRSTKKNLNFGGPKKMSQNMGSHLLSHLFRASVFSKKISPRSRSTFFF